MGVLYKTDSRNLLPRWRNVESELASTKGLITTHAATIKSNLGPTVQLDDWKDSKSLPNAADLLTSAKVLGLQAEHTDAAEYIISHASPTSLIYNVAKQSLDIEDLSIQFKPVPSLEVKHGRKIAYYRALLRQGPINPIAWVELGRHYIALGENVKAKSAIQSALSIDRNSRFIVRSAARYYHHAGDPDEGLRVLHRSDRVKYDPWIMASEIAFASMLDRQTRLAKNGLQLIEDKRFEFFEVTELASALATLEMKNGKSKNAKRLVSLSLEMPNDNSFAQAMWYREQFAIPSWKFENMTIQSAWEGTAQLEYQNANFSEALVLLEQWQQDEPYSSRPLLLKSYILGSILGEVEQSAELLEKEFHMHSTNWKVLNNLLYYKLLSGTSKNLEKNVYQLKRAVKGLSRDESIATKATLGLYMFRSGHIATGRDLYRQAISGIEKGGNVYGKAVAVANYVREELLANESPEIVSTALDMQQRACSQRTEYDVKILVDRNNKLQSQRVL